MISSKPAVTAAQSQANPTAEYIEPPPFPSAVETRNGGLMLEGLGLRVFVAMDIYGPIFEGFINREFVPEWYAKYGCQWCLITPGN